MKRLIAAAVLALFVVAALVTDILVTDNVVEILSADISNCKSAAEQGDYKAAEKYARALESNWEKIENYYTPFINHSLIDDMGVSVSKLVPLAKTQNAMFLTECRVIEVTLTHIKNDSRFHLHNIL